jgi:Na+/proline symporter
MSSADAEINVASIALVHDVIKPLANLSGYKILESTELSMMRICVFLFGAVAIVISSSFKSIFDIIIGALDFWGPYYPYSFFCWSSWSKSKYKNFYI